MLPKPFEIEANLGELEEAYRLHFLKADVNQVILVVGLGLLLILLNLRSDYILLGYHPTFYKLLILRSFVILSCVLLLFILKKNRSYWVYDFLVFTLLMIAVTADVCVNLTRPLDFYGHVVFEIIILLACYLLLPTNIIIRTSVALIHTFISLWLLLFYKTLGPPVRYMGIISFAVMNITGFIISVQLYTYRRLQFRYRIEHEKVETELERLAMTDPLTGVNNRRAFELQAENIFAISKKYKRPLSLMMLDIDHFKHINDKFGHSSGDEVLRRFTQIFMQRIREQDMFGRLGGEEFCLMMPETPLGEVLNACERLRDICSETKISTNNHEINFTVSIGVVEIDETDTSFEKMLKRADAMLYKAKETGRNRVVWE